jgi:hypothetical protein
VNPQRIVGNGSTSFHLTNSSNRHVGVTECGKLQSMSPEHTKFHQNPYMHQVGKCAQTDVTGEVQVGLGWGGLG